MITAGNQSDFIPFFDSQSEPLGEGESLGNSDRYASHLYAPKSPLCSRRALTGMILLSHFLAVVPKRASPGLRQRQR